MKLFEIFSNNGSVHHVLHVRWLDRNQSMGSITLYLNPVSSKSWWKKTINDSSCCNPIKSSEHSTDNEYRQHSNTRFTLTAYSFTILIHNRSSWFIILSSIIKFLLGGSPTYPGWCQLTSFALRIASTRLHSNKR